MVRESRHVIVRKLSGTIAVTGGAGFIARALYRRAEAEGWDAEFFAIGRRDETLRHVQERFRKVSAVRRVDVTDEELLAATFRELSPEIVIHAAASKFVDLSEANAWDTERVNVGGSKATLRAALASPRLRCATAISTDKAAAPVNTYGMTKALMERLWQEADRWRSAEGVRVTVVRYGNVIGSTGSALPRMRAQAARGEAVTVTDPDMTRFWLTADEALDALLVAVLEAPGGTLTVPTEVRSSRLITAVHAAVGDLKLVHLGERPGEKTHETLLTANEWRRSAEGPLGYLFVSPPVVGGEPAPARPDADLGRALTSDAPWGGPISSAELAEALDDAEGI